MKKTFLTLCTFLFMTTIAYSANIPSTGMKIISQKCSPVYNQTEQKWEAVKNKKLSEPVNTGCDFNFLNQGKLVGYSNSDMKFYEFSEGRIDSKKELDSEEIQKLFPSYKIIKISDFSKSTNSLKIKKHIKNLRLLLINDSEQNFQDYKFTSGNAKFKTFGMRSFLVVKKEGMIQFSNNDDNLNKSPWYVLLVR